MKLGSGIRLTAVVLLPLIFSGCWLFSMYTLTLTIENDMGGTITSDPAASEYNGNTIVNLTAEASSGWEFDSWSGITTEDGAAATVLMDANRTVTAVFKPILSKTNPTDGKINPPAVGFAPAAGDSWTFMIYLDADNNLEPYSLLDFNEMEEGLMAADNANMEIIVLYDRRDDGAGDTDWQDTRTYRVSPDDSLDIDSELLTTGFNSELNMGDPDTLTDFLNFCKTEAPAENYALIFWNHGGGARSLDFTEDEPQGRHICEDEEAGDFLFMDEVQQAVGAAFPGGLDVIGLDACIMGTVEAAYELRALCDYYVASMSSVNGEGWEYSDLFGRMQLPSAASDPEALALLMVDSYRDLTSSYTDQSISAVRSTGLETLKEKIDLLSAELYGADAKVIIEDIRDNTVHFFDDDYALEVVSQPYYDLNDLCYLLLYNENLLSPSVTAAASGVLTALESSVLSAYGGSSLGNYYGSGDEVGRGLSIFFSNGNLMYNNVSHYAYQHWYTDMDLDGTSWGPYGLIDFCSSDNDENVESWRELMEAWYDPYRPPVGYTPGSW